MAAVPPAPELAAKPLHLPVLLAQRTAVVLSDPQLHAAVVEGMVTLSPHHCNKEDERERET